jgi:hypothetical protein
MSETDFPLPPPTFEFLVFSLKTQAEMQLGLYSFGDEKSADGPNLPAARHAIDLLSMIAEKTRGNLSLEEQRLTENALTELRFRYVQATEKAAQEKTAKESAAQAEAVPERAAEPEEPAVS